MSAELNDVDELFRRRTILIGEISKYNAEHLRILQLSSGVEILLMKDHDSPEEKKKKSDVDSKVATSQARLDQLETDLAKIDSQIKIALNRES